jgi:hypothetical protein
MQKASSLETLVPFYHCTRRRILVELNFSGIFLKGTMSVMGNRTVVFGIATRLRIGRSRASILGTGKRFCLEFHGIVPPPNRPDRLWGPHSILFSWYRGSFLRVQRQGRKVNHSLAFSAEVKNEYAFMSWTGRTLPSTKSIMTLAIPLRIRYRHVLHQL